MTTSTLLAGLMLFAAGLLLGRATRAREVNRLTENEELARECMRNAMKARDEMAQVMFHERSRRKFLESLAGMHDEEGRRIWN